MGADPGNHNLTGVWSISPPPTQYSEVTLGAVASGGGGPIVRIDRTNNGQTGWLLFLYQNSPTVSGIYKLTSDGGFTAVKTFTPTIVSGDKWRLTADGNLLTVSRNGVSQFTYVTDGAYAAGDVGMETYTSGFTFLGWEGGATTAPPPDTTPPTAPSNAAATASSTSQIGLSWTASTDDVGVTNYFVERCQGAGCSTFAPAGSAPTSPYNDTGLAAGTSYSYRVRATDAAGNLSGYSNVASATTQASADTTPPTAPSALTAAAASSSQVSLSWTASTDDVGVTGYRVERCQGAGCATFAQVGTASGTTYGDSGLAAGTSYSYRVRATDAAGNLSGYSNVASATTQSPPPTITSFTPASGPVSTSVSINGTNFTGATAVKFNGMSATFAVTSDSAVRATVPVGATSGPISVATPQGTATSGTSFTVTAGLAASKAGNGAGTITSTSNPANPSQINCTVTCSTATVSYPIGTVVTLTASPAIGSTFTRWDGCDSTSGATCSVTLNANRSVTATFTLQTFALTVTKSSTLGVGSGTVSSTSTPASPTQIDCGSRCSVSFDYGTVVTLTATPGMLSLFDGWTGCDSASGDTCTVTVTSARSVRANFLP
jgi:fibronectin type 3 domain-containing protein